MTIKDKKMVSSLNKSGKAGYQQSQQDANFSAAPITTEQLISEPI